MEAYDGYSVVLANCSPRKMLGAAIELKVTGTIFSSVMHFVQVQLSSCRHLLLLLGLFDGERI